MQTCETCRFWANPYCRRFLPQLQPIIYDTFHSWPMTRADDWCGEHKEKDKPDE